MSTTSHAQSEKKSADVTSAQLRAARSLLNWTARELSVRAGVHRNTITRAETDGTAHGHAVAQLVRTLEAAGVEFIAENGSGPGVRLRKDMNAGNAQGS
jgi:transcriptional regulator with XRE-family HTH domain